jgi:hypothetical protein
MHAFKTTSLVALFALAGSATGQTDADEQVQAVIEEYDTAYKAFYKAYRAADSDEARSAIVENELPSTEDYATQLWELTDQYEGSEAALDAMVWIAQSAGTDENTTRIIDVSVAFHMDSDKLGTILARARLSEKSLPNVEAILEESASESTRAQACFALGSFWKGRADSDESVLPKALAYFERVGAEFAEVKSYNTTMGQRAEGELFEMKSLVIGMVAPEITAEDLDGVSFNLSDYRGKVVVLDFWGDW